MGKIICWFSCGITSAVACKLAINEYGKDNCDLVYIGIKNVHPDNDRFISDCEKWFDKEITTISSKKFSSHTEVIRKAKYINGPKGAPCTKKLKKDVRIEYEKNNPFENQVFGYEFELRQINRAIRFKQQYPYTKPLYPLINRKLDKNACAFIIKNAGIEIPTMYKLGFSNNNCIGCVKGGAGYFNRIKKHFPDNFNELVEIENSLGRSCLNGKFLKDLKPDEGRNEPDIMPDCGLFCEVEFADLLDPLTEQVLNGKVTII